MTRAEKYADTAWVYLAHVGSDRGTRHVAGCCCGCAVADYSATVPAHREPNDRRR
ncbi:hypothetical protein ACIA8C_04985 [Nocardia sp. NPDC051321]|uniref:hypothetical protein n=1 Tax=Nocardia sp. NPDC051321 TaxID=3364323 RepID=UPI0037A6413F